MYKSWTLAEAGDILIVKSSSPTAAFTNNLRVETVTELSLVFIPEYWAIPL